MSRFYIWVYKGMKVKKQEQKITFQQVEVKIDRGYNKTGLKSLRLQSSPRDEGSLGGLLPYLRHRSFPWWQLSVCAVTVQVTRAVILQCTAAPGGSCLARTLTNSMLLCKSQPPSLRSSSRIPPFLQEGRKYTESCSEE